MNWLILWKIVLLFTLFGYGLLVIIVTIGGVGNVVSLFQDLKEPSEDTEE